MKWKNRKPNMGDWANHLRLQIDRKEALINRLKREIAVAPLPDPDTPDDATHQLIKLKVFTENEVKHFEDELTTILQPAVAEPTLTRGAMIEALRKETGWTVEKLAAEVDIDERNYRRHVKNGEMHSNTLYAYEVAFTQALKRKIKLPKEP